MLSFMGGGGQLGHGVRGAEEKPRLITSFQEYAAKAKQVSCGGKHTLILTDDGEVLSCGVGEYGRLGTGSNDDALEPTPIEALADEDIVQIAAGYDHSLALTANGHIYTWGRNNLGQLGLSDSFIDIYSMEDFPRLVDQASISPPEENDDDDAPSDESPVLFSQIAAGNGRSAAITTDGQLYVWGSRISHMPKLFDRNIGLFDGLKCKKVACGGDSGKAVVLVTTEDGALYTFGDASSKMLGLLNRTGKQPLPARVDSMSSNGRQVVDISCGFGSHAFAFVRVSDE